KIVIGEERLRVYVAYDRGHNGSGRMDVPGMKHETNKSHGNVNSNTTNEGRMNNRDGRSFAKVLNVGWNRKEGFNKNKGAAGGETHLNDSATGTYGTQNQYDNKYRDADHEGVTFAPFVI
nr:serine carboxypeptidase-like 34 [Tanacetum cinerariifolium]